MLSIMARYFAVISISITCSFAFNIEALAKQGIDEKFTKPVGEVSWGHILADYVGYSGYEKSYALVIGVSEYDDSSFTDLPTDKDPIRIKDYLLNEAGFDYVHLLTEDKVTAARINDLMVDVFPGLMHGNDRFLFYWSGHGVTRGVGQGSRGYLPIKTSPYNKYGRMISMQDIKRWNGLLTDIRQSLYLLDSCFGGLAGSVAQSNIRISKINLLSKKSSHLLTAGNAKQQTIALDSLGGSVFTYAVLEGLRGSADAASAYPRDGVVTLFELKAYVESRVDQLRKDVGWEKEITPQIRDLGSSDGEFYFMTSEGKVKKMSTVGSEASGDFQYGIPIPLGTPPVRETPKMVAPTTTGRLTVTVKPEDARVRIMNIKPRYRNGIALELNKSYDILVTSPDYKSYSNSILLTQVDQELNVILKRISSKSVEEESVNSKNNLPFIPMSGLGIPPPDKNNEKAFTLYSQCVAGDAAGCSGLGYLYSLGEEVVQDTEKAISLYRQACDAGDASGCRNLGARYSIGSWVEQDAEKAVSLFRLACDADNAIGCISLGFQYQIGEGVEQDAEQAASLYRQACDAGDAQGCSYLGVQYLEGQGVEQDTEKAISLYRQACDAGDASGCRNLGLIYSNGQGVEQDAEQAVSLYRQACDAGDAQGCSYLGFQYQIGEGVEQDAEQAVSLYRQACDAGDSWGCSRL